MHVYDLKQLLEKTFVSITDIHRREITCESHRPMVWVSDRIRRHRVFGINISVCNQLALSSIKLNARTRYIFRYFGLALKLYLQS